MTILLASRSETRRLLLESARVKVETVISDFDEEAVKRGLSGLAPAAIAARLAEAKAKAVPAGPDRLVLGADQILERDDGSILNKAGSREEAMDQLRSLSGRTHWLHSSAAMIRDGVALWQATETARLKMRRLDAHFLETYLDAEFSHVRGNVGVYRIEGPGIILFETIEGSHFAILGLPLLPLLAFLRDQGEMP